MMRNGLRGVTLAGVGLLLGAPRLWAHPGHITEGGLWHSLRHLLTSPYHVAVIVGVVVLAVAWTVAIRSRSRSEVSSRAR